MGIFREKWMPKTPHVLSVNVGPNNGLTPRQKAITWNYDDQVSMSQYCITISSELKQENRFYRRPHLRQRVLSLFNASTRTFVRPERRYRSNSLRIPAIWLKFGEMWHNNMKQIAIKMTMFGHFCKFHGTLEFSMIGFDWVWGTTLPLTH